jgi:hypothetical protein
MASDFSVAWQFSQREQLFSFVTHQTPMLLSYLNFFVQRDQRFYVRSDDGRRAVPDMGHCAQVPESMTVNFNKRSSRKGTWTLSKLCLLKKLTETVSEMLVHTIAFY